MAIAGLAALAAKAVTSKGGLMGAVSTALGVTKEKKRRRRRMLTQADKSDIMFLVGAVGKANAARFAAMRVH